MKRKLVEKALCEQLSQLNQRSASSAAHPFDSMGPLNRSIIVVIDAEFPSSLKNELLKLQSAQILYRVPGRSFLFALIVDESQRRRFLEQLLSTYDNALSEHALNRLLIHSSAFSLAQLRLLFDNAFFCMLLCKDNAIPVDAFDLASIPKASMYQTLARYIQDQMNGVSFIVFAARLTCRPVVPSIPDSILLSLLDKEKPSFSVVDVSRDIDFCKAVARPDDEIQQLNAMTKLLRERDDQIRKRDAENDASASRDPIERRSGEPYQLTTPKPVSSVAAETTQTESQKASNQAKKGLQSPKFGQILMAESMNTSAERYRQELEAQNRQEAERLKQAEKKNLEERERLRREEEARRKQDEERRRAEFEAQKRKEEERQRRIEEKIAAEQAARERKLEEQRKKREEAERKRKEELERQEEERRRKEMEEMERREAERQALAEKRRQKMQDEIDRKERENRREAEEQMKRYEEERRRIYEASMGFDRSAYNESTSRLESKMSAERQAMLEDQRKREAAVKKARQQAMERLNQEKLQRKMEQDTYRRLLELRRPAPKSEREKEERIGKAKETIESGRKRVEALMRLKEEVKKLIEEKRRKEEEERKRREEEERKRREEEERKRKEEEARLMEKRRAEEEEMRRQKAIEEERQRKESEARRAEFEKEKQERRKMKQAKAKAMEERLQNDELRLLDCREKLLALRKLMNEVKRSQR